MAGKPPAELPESFSEIWKALSAADELSPSRQVLAKELGISTNTIQRILVDGDVPCLKEHTSNRVIHSWARIVTRLALYFDRDPGRWVRMVGIAVNSRVKNVMDREISRRDPGQDPDRNERDAEPVESGVYDRAFFEYLGRTMLESIAPGIRDRKLVRDELLKSIGRAFSESGNSRRVSGEKEGKYCLSCLAPLSDEDNTGASDVYCRYCSDENGNLLPREKVQEVIARWFMDWQSELTPEEAARRADHYLRAMPAWNRKSS